MLAFSHNSGRGLVSGYLLDIYDLLHAQAHPGL